VSWWALARRQELSSVPDRFSGGRRHFGRAAGIGPRRSEAGRELARTWCTSCHVVDVEGEGTDAGPALPALLGDGQRTEDELRGWLAAPHPPMPDFALTRQEIENIVAYLQSLTR
jgi:cytochrome c